MVDTIMVRYEPRPFNLEKEFEDGENKYFAMDIISAVGNNDFELVKLIVQRYKEYMFDESEEIKWEK